MSLQTNALFHGDNLAFLRDRSHFPDASVDLVYLDPPFNTRRDHHVVFAAASNREQRAEIAFEDSWSWDDEAQRTYEGLSQSRAPVSTLLGAFHEALGTSDVMAYLTMMTPRLMELHRVLKPTGSLYLHCDPGASHYLKVVLDQIFGPTNFRREIVWRSGWVSGFKAAARNWVRNHDVLLYYVKDLKAPPYFGKEKAYAPHSESYRRRGGGGNPKGVALDDVWTEVELMSPWIKSFSKEKLGYRTQKPLALLKRIVEISCPPGGVVLDPFLGTGTTAVAAGELGRLWVGIDLSRHAVEIARSRLDASREGELVPAGA